MNLRKWYQGQTFRLPVLCNQLSHLDPWIVAYEALYNSFGEEMKDAPSFTSFEKARKSDGKLMELHKPNRSMEILQNSFVNHFSSVMKNYIEENRVPNANVRDRLKSFISLPSSFAYKPGSKVSTVIEKHKGRQYFLVIDLKSAFETVDISLLAKLLTCILISDDSPSLLYFSAKQSILHKKFTEELFSEEEMVLYLRMYKFLTRFCTKNKDAGTGLLRGSQSSPWLFNILCEGVIDKSINFLLNSEKGVKTVYTRYGDDLIFSSKLPIVFKRRLMRLIRNVFQINHQKMRYVNLEKDSVEMLGFSYNQEERVVFPTKKRNKLHSLIHKSIRDPQNESKRGQALGYIGYFLEYVSMNQELLTSSDIGTMRRIEEFKFTKF